VTNAFDQAVDRAADAIRNPAMDRVMYTLSSAADHSILWFVIGGARGVAARDPAFVAKFATVMGLESALTNGLLKGFVGRTRPTHEIAEGPLPYGMRRPITSSFPSGHATAAFTAASILAATGRGSVRWYLLAGVVASTRVYTKMHHASDVLAGAALGLAMGHAARRWFTQS
jgi:undecaprenyl-diphosphatase